MTGLGSGTSEANPRLRRPRLLASRKDSRGLMDLGRLRTTTLGTRTGARACRVTVARVRLSRDDARAYMSTSNAPTPQELPAPEALPRRRGRELLTGIHLLPERRLQAFSPDDLERVIAWWLHEEVRGHYQHIVSYAGTGDKGRDIVGFEGPLGTDPWDNYQCKQYDKKLGPADVVAEVAKVVFYVTRGEYTRPRRYTFVAAKGLSPQAIDLIGDHDKLRRRLLDRWEKDAPSLCPLDEIKDAISAFSFPQFAEVSAGQIVRDLYGTLSYPYFFGGGLTKPRPENRVPPAVIAAYEMPYITELLAAYDDHCSLAVATVELALAHGDYGPDLRGSRKDFYCAESLREFSKDAYPEPETFPDLQELVHTGIRFTLARDHASGYDRSLAVREHATVLQLGDHPLADNVDPADRSGICHQLVNDRKFRWVR